MEKECSNKEELFLNALKKAKDKKITPPEKTDYIITELEKKKVKETPKN